MNDSFAEALNNLGYSKGLSLDEAKILQDKIGRRGWNGVFGNSLRLYPADAEDLAEGGVGNFIVSVKPFFRAEGVDLPDIEDNLTEDGYVIRVGNEINIIYDAAELKRETSKGEPGLIWGLSMARTFAILSKLLETAGSRERIYAVNGGNDLFAFFLTPELYEVIMNHPDACPADGPYSPTEKYPLFGQPCNTDIIG